MSSIAKSSISSPLLTCTTNARVADVENVEYSDILLPDYSTNNITTSTGCDNGSEDKKTLVQETEKSSVWTSTVHNMKLKLNLTRRASTNLFLDSPWFQRASGREEAPAAVLDDSGVATSSKNSAARCFSRRKEAHSEPGRRGKLKHLPNKVNDSHAKQSQTALRTQQAPRLPALYSDSTTDVLCHSLSRSFASAIDKLDYQSSPTLVHDGTPISRLKKVRSFFSLHKASWDISQHSLSKEGSVVGSASLRFSPDVSDGISILTAENPSANKQVRQSKIKSYRPTALKFSSSKNRHLKAKPDQKGPIGVNPLKMHPDVKSFASLPSHTGLTVTPGHASHNSVDREIEDQSQSLERAVIYSPSTGDLSEYSRQTPPPSASVRERATQETPTRKPLHKQGGLRLKKSVSTFFGKSASAIKFASSTPPKKPRVEKTPATTDKPLSQRNIFGNISRENSADKLQDNSMSAPDMYGADGVRVALNYQPSTPSPLRKSTKIKATTGGRQRAVTTTTPVRPPTEGVVLAGPRSATVMSDPEKRFARYIEHDHSDFMVS